SVPDAVLMRRRLMPLVRFIRWLPFMPKIGSDVRDPVARRAHTTYTRIPLRAVAELYPLTREMEAALPHVTAPTLLVRARKDRIVPASAAARIVAQLGGPSHLATVPRGGHTVVVDYGRDFVFEVTTKWLKGEIT
ncbi:MAG: alpha/beta hydrolase, partial [Anaerolineae bacterium]|nr:alpha/beta hydrolase [Anaerolineae bacterium]